MQEDHPLLINQHHKSKKSVSKSFLAILSAFVVLLAAATITLGVLYYLEVHNSDDKFFKLTTGDEVLVNSGFSQLSGFRVGLITNPTAVVNSVHIIDRMFFTPNNVGMSLVALFGPEHGLRGDDPAGASIGNTVDPRTNLTIYSLYGEIRAPTLEMIEDNNITAFVFDIQDVGARFYTYITTLGLCMQAAANQSIPFYVLDRPNPIGNEVSGWTLETNFTSFEGLYPIPVQYGLTSGELAKLIKGEGLLPGLENLDLNIIKMEGYHPKSIWSQLSLPWISPSPNIVDIDTALLYPGTGFFEAFNNATEGRGTLAPFKTIGAPWINSTALINQLQAFKIPGVRFTATQFVPVNISGMSGIPKFYQQVVNGIEIQITDRSKVKGVELGVYLVYSFYQQASVETRVGLIDENYLGLHTGTDQLYQSLISGDIPVDIIAQWKASNQLFLQTRKPYLLYNN